MSICLTYSDNANVICYISSSNNMALMMHKIVGFLKLVVNFVHYLIKNVLIKSIKYRIFCYQFKSK